MNCFQKFYFYDDLQHAFSLWFNKVCCELLSKVLFLRWFTTCGGFNKLPRWLWIAFKSSIFTMIYNNISPIFSNVIVVNCFQKFYFYDDLQPGTTSSIIVTSCELLSKVLFLRWFTTSHPKHSSRGSLWIAFKSSIFTMIYNQFFGSNRIVGVVNCFQKFYFYDDLQQI